MRIGLVTPRINGTPIFAMRPSMRLGYAAGTPQGQIDSYVNSFIDNLPSHVEQGSAIDPSVVAESLATAARETCNNTGQCPDMSAQIAAAVASYTAALDAQQGKTQAQVEQGQIGVPTSYFDANPTVYSPIQNPNVPNALNTAAPQPVVVTPPPPTNVLTPPSTPAPVSGTNAGTGTGTTALTSGPGALSGSVSVGGFDIPTWALLGAAAIGVLMMVKGK